MEKEGDKVGKKGGDEEGKKEGGEEENVGKNEEGARKQGEGRISKARKRRGDREEERMNEGSGAKRRKTPLSSTGKLTERQGDVSQEHPLQLCRVSSPPSSRVYVGSEAEGGVGVRGTVCESGGGSERDKSQGKYEQKEELVSANWVRLGRFFLLPFSLSPTLSACVLGGDPLS